MMQNPSYLSSLVEVWKWGRLSGEIRVPGGCPVRFQQGRSFSLGAEGEAWVRFRQNKWSAVYWEHPELMFWLFTASILIGQCPCQTCYSIFWILALRRGLFIKPKLESQKVANAMRKPWSTHGDLESNKHQRGGTNVWKGWVGGWSG